MHKAVAQLHAFCSLTCLAFLPLENKDALRAYTLPILKKQGQERQVRKGRQGVSCVGLQELQFTQKMLGPLISP